MNHERLKEIEFWELCKGQGAAANKKLCIMQVVDYISSGGESDHPECACPILTAYAIRLNDAFSAPARQLLKPFIPLLVGTKSTAGVQIARNRLLRWRNVTVAYLLLLDILKLGELAKTLRSFENTPEAMAQAKDFLSAKKTEIFKVAADADADALREKIMVSALETLKLAIEITEEKI